MGLSEVSNLKRTVNLLVKEKQKRTLKGGRGEGNKF